MRPRAGTVIVEGCKITREASTPTRVASFGTRAGLLHLPENSRRGHCIGAGNRQPSRLHCRRFRAKGRFLTRPGHRSSGPVDSLGEGLFLTPTRARV